MKRAILGFVFSLWASIASAGINCPLPFTLVNGTTADASQVMANYNALVSCLASAANAGANTDITSLLGMTTPLNQASGGSPMFVGGTSTGSANAQAIASLVPANYTLTPKFFVAFLAGFTNTGPTTWNVNSTGAVNVVIHTATGLSSLSGGEIVAGQVTLAFYDGTQYQLLDAAPATGFVQPCTIIDYGGVGAPAGYVPADGSPKLRASFPNLFACMSLTVPTTTSSGNPAIVFTNPTPVSVGWFVGGTNISCNSTILVVTDSMHVTLSNNAGGNGTTTLTIGPQPQGDCSTTFNVPNFNGRGTAMVDLVGSTLNSTTCTNATSVGSQCGVQTTQLTSQAQLPNVNFIVSGATQANTTYGPLNINGLGGGTLQNIGNTTLGTINVNSGGSSAAFPNVPPIGLVLKAIKF